MPKKINEKPGAFISHSEAKIITNFAFKTRAGALPGNVVKTNQDSYIVHTNFCQMREAAFYAICDGHGVNGHLVSGFVKEVLPSFQIKIYKINVQIFTKIENLEREYKSRNSDLKRTFLEAFDRTYKELDSTSIDINFSGTTTVSLLLLNKSLYSANVGDSRAILISCNKQGEWSSQPLSRDQKPDDPLEMQRILKCGGRVEAFKDYNGDPVGPARVWLKHENIPGLAMARSIGDKVAAQVGVLAEPEIMEFQLTEEDKMIVLASDGVWEFLSNDQVMNYILPLYLKNQPELACEKVIKESVNWWKKVSF